LRREKAEKLKKLEALGLVQPGKENKYMFLGRKTQKVRSFRTRAAR
jgi:hypothetical protein